MASTILPAGYALDPAWHAERDRLDSLTSLYDARTLRLCDRLGLAAGWHCLDAGAGTGTLATAPAERVGPTGSVTALGLRHPLPRAARVGAPGRGRGRPGRREPSRRPLRSRARPPGARAPARARPGTGRSRGRGPPGRLVDDRGLRLVDRDGRRSAESVA